jgi:hypothetical protein
VLFKLLGSTLIVHRIPPAVCSFSAVGIRLATFLIMTSEIRAPLGWPFGLDPPTIFELDQTLELTRALVVGTGFTALAG